MSCPIDIHGILEHAGADADAPEGSQAWALAQVDRVAAELIDALCEIADVTTPGDGIPNGQWINERATEALANIGSAS